MKKIFLLIIIITIIISGCSHSINKSRLSDEEAGKFKDFVEEETVVELDNNTDTKSLTPKPTNSDKYIGQKETESPNQKQVEFTIKANQWDFEPAVITVNEGDLVKINVKSMDVAHGIAIPDFSVNKKFGAGEEVSFEFVANKKGEFTFFCNVFCGSGHGDMTGKLIVK